MTANSTKGRPTFDKIYGKNLDKDDQIKDTDKKVVEHYERSCGDIAEKGPYTGEFNVLCASSLLQEMRNATLAETIVERNYATIPVRLARIYHDKSIIESQINAQEYQNIISSGLAGLVAYHDGGLTSDEVASVISFAQAVGVGVIAGRVN